MERLSADSEYKFCGEYFRTFTQELENNCFMVACLSDRGIEAASLFMLYKEYAHYHLSGRSSNSSSNFATNMILDAAIKIAINAGCRYFHLGGGRSPAADDSLLKFKRNFSKQTSDFYIGKKVHNQRVYDQLIEQWKEKHSLSAAKYGHMLQGYRKLDA